MDLYLKDRQLQKLGKFPNFQYCKNRLCSEGYISEGNALICFILVVKQYS